jgi:hypothetical protein
MDEPDGQRSRVHIVELIDKHDDELHRNPERIKFLCIMDQDGREELLTYNQVMDYLNRDLERILSCGSSNGLFPIKDVSSIMTKITKDHYI